MSEKFIEPMALIAEMAARLGVNGINELPGCWEHTFEQGGNEWFLALNGHREAVECSQGASVDPFHAYVQCNGWPAGVMNPFDGIMAAGAAVNEDVFVEALQAEIDRLPEPPQED